MRLLCSPNHDGKHISLRIDSSKARRIAKDELGDISSFYHVVCSIISAWEPVLSSLLTPKTILEARTFLLIRPCREQDPARRPAETLTFHKPKPVVGWAKDAFLLAEKLATLACQDGDEGVSTLRPISNDDRRIHRFSDPEKVAHVLENNQVRG